MSEYYSNEYLNGQPAERDAHLKAWARSRLAAADSFDPAEALMAESFQVGGEALGPIKAVGTAGKILKPAIQGAISGFAFFDPYEERVSNLIQAWPAVANPVTEFLAAKEDDGRLEGRLKRALEEAGFGVAAEGAAKLLGSGLRAIKKILAVKAVAETSPEAAEAVFKGLNEAAAEARAAEALETRPAQRMIKSEHPYGWSGPAKEITTVHQNADEPLRWVVKTSKGPKEISLPELIKFRNNGQLNKRNTKDVLLKHAGSIYERFELAPVEIPGGGGIRGLLPVNEHNAFQATLGKGDIRHMIVQAKNEADFLAIQSIPDIWRTSVYEGTGDWIVKGGTPRPHSDFFWGVHTFKNKIEIKGDMYDVTITVRETDTGKNYYHQKTTKID